AALDEVGEMPAQCCRRHAVGTRNELLIRRPHDQLARAGKLRVGVKRQQRVQDRESPVGGADRIARFLNIPENLPLLHAGSAGDVLCRHLRCKHAERHRPPPERRRCQMRLHLSLTYVEAKETCSPKRRTEPPGLLTAIRGFAILSVATRSEKASAAVTFRGPFLLPATAPSNQFHGIHRRAPAGAAG